ncbi:hypothetical protein ACFPC0_11080 [Streptomyces andamanensis]|uniref:Uncharacterized protein n=1 Tax=Streptomyces andamanensis TaxID=1565035 RepID=A0ABV8TCS7_9ACTN
MEPSKPLEQLTPEAYGTLVAGLSEPQRTALLGAVGGMLSCRENTLAALRRKGLVGATPQTMQNLTALGRRLRAGLLVPPGTFGSAVVQALLDGGLPWDELPSGTLRPRCRIETFEGATTAYVDTRALNGTANEEALVTAEKVLLAAGFHVTRTEGRSPRLLASP